MRRKNSGGMGIAGFNAQIKSSSVKIFPTFIVGNGSGVSFRLTWTKRESGSKPELYPQL
jgi:hypothetical protein